MNRYQFEDLISEYIENNLPLSKRREFENYLENKPEEKERINKIRLNIKLFNSIHKVKVSEKFNDNLMNKIKSGSNKKLGSIFYNDGIILGFKPMNIISLFSLVCFSIFLGNELYKEMYVEDYKKPALITNKIRSEKNIDEDFKNLNHDKYNKDSLKIINNKKNNFSNKIQLVND